MSLIRAAVLGAGDRGNIYANYALQEPNKFKIVAVADTNPKKIDQFSAKFGIDKESRFSNWEDVFSIDIDIDAVIITLPDQLHYPALLRAIEKNYHVLLEKPISSNLEQIYELQEKLSTYSAIIQICHVLRYTPFFQTIKQLIDDGKIGDIVTIDISENVSYYHYAHSYIRGNWHNSKKSAPMILAKSSHDMDILYWLTNSLPSKISSFGSQSYFGKTNKPVDTPARCTDGCPVADKCLYYAPRIYLDIIPLLHINKRSGPFWSRLLTSLILRFPGLRSLPVFNKVNEYDGWPVNIITEDPTMENRLKALENGPYGRCVYDIEDHDVVDHQVVNIEFENGVTAVFTMHGHSSEEAREIRINGTKGTITGRFASLGNWIKYTDSLTNSREVTKDTKIQTGHGGGDIEIIRDFVENISNNTQPMTNFEESIISHIMALTADEARKNNKVIELTKLFTI